ncbi:U3 snoRNP protein [Recurvomyces mirabilis]|uniref:U3 small nucleolar RNA-associated protein 22 n=1 Tax=Recurvomyces mirabilis TaxID=574656 RepID=A0AAE0WSC2_9PEZI|nr:U3 snoRNP protein [Recurvomyces mirabilis]KAK5159553.1 U3 snoRNP protein [Recurvomyces mirabilis]
MADRAMKRRKVEHTPSDDEADDASFASFGDGEDETAQEDSMAAEQRALPEDDERSLHQERIEDDLDSETEVIADETSDSGEDVDMVDDEDDEHSAHNAVVSKQDIKAKQNRNTSMAKKQVPSSAFTAGTFKSNMFKLQVDELLAQIRPRRGKREEAVDQALHALKTTFDSMEPVAPLSVSEARRKLLTTSKVSVPFPSPGPPKDAKYTLQHAKPAGINVVGSYPLKTNSRTDTVLKVDMMVAMPSALFQEKDYLNYRYFYKRAYYLACLAAAIQSAHRDTYEVQFSDFRGDQLKPVLVIVPKAPQSSVNDEIKPAAKWRINVMPCVNLDVFSASKLLPTKNCIRNTEQSSDLKPTPLYNSSLRSDMLLATYLEVIHGVAGRCEAFRDSCLLGATWLQQRGFGSGIADGGFGNFEWAALIASMLQGGGPNGKPLLSDGYSSYQLFKATLQALAVRDLSKQALVIAPGNIKPVGDGSPMVWDGARHHNILYKVTPWAYAQLRQEAKLTITTLGDQLYDGFDSTFITKKKDAMTRFDVSVNISLPKRSSPDQPEDIRVQLARMHDVLKRGLGDRTTLIALKPTLPPPWQLGMTKSESRPRVITLGFVVDPDNVHRTVDHGPSAEAKAEAAAFRTFWGDKAELRRFKDGSITESLIWAAGEDGQTILEQIVRHLLAKHFSLVTEGVSFSAKDFASLLRHGARTANFQPLLEAYKQMEMDVRGLEALPLSIRHIMPADGQLRYASIRPPGVAAAGEKGLPAQVTIQFEGSTRWPDDVVAIQRTKIAFLLKLSELLQEANGGITARIGLENQHEDILNQGFLDIVYESGAAFRMRIYHDREQTLLERQLKDNNLAPSVKEAAAQALAKHKRDYIRRPAQTQAISRMCTRYPALSGTIRLFKKWFSSHLLSNHIAEEVIELIAIRTFVQPWPWGVPSSVQTGFLRALHWLARWDWRAEPLIVDLSGNDELKLADGQGMRTRFEAWRKLDPSLNRIVLFAATNLDPDGTTWTDGHPQRVVAGRMTALARSACAHIEEQQSALQPASLFASSLSDYDFVLQLDTGRKRSKAVAYKNLELAAVDDDTSIGYNAAELFLYELESLYGSAILFFHGGQERSIIAGLWSPGTSQRNWKMNLPYSTIPSKSSKEVGIMAKVNREGILSDIARLGGDLIESIEVNAR